MNGRQKSLVIELHLLGKLSVVVPSATDPLGARKTILGSFLNSPRRGRNRQTNHESGRVSRLQC